MQFQWAIVYKQKKNKGKILWSCQRAKKNVEHGGDGDSSCSWSPWNGHQRVGNDTGGAGDQRKNWDHKDPKLYRIVIKCPEDLRKQEITLALKLA